MLKPPSFLSYLFLIWRVISISLSYVPCITQGQELSLTPQGLWELSNTSAWLKILHYEGPQSVVDSSLFFLSPEGSHNPTLELIATLQGLQAPSHNLGPEGVPVACAFPVRKKWLERELKISFPPVSCSDLEHWLKGINADRASILFAGAYSKNPASLFGHTILRLYNETSERKKEPLLSYVVGFGAITDPNDSRASYVLKGIFGGYTGVWSLEPFYEKLGAYNNSESRDLWEQQLNLTSDEVDTLLRALWEVHLYGKTPYYFIKKNCSYRLLGLLEIARPSSELRKSFNFMTLPYETLRALETQGWLKTEIHFYSSIERRIHERTRLFSHQQVQQFQDSKKNILSLQNLQDALVLDALIDYWILKNYQKNGSLASEEALLLEATYKQRAQLKEISHPLESDDLISKRDQLDPPHLGHRPHELTLSGGQSSSEMSLKYILGAHSFLAPTQGYDQFAAIEYFGFELRPHYLQLLLFDIKSFEPITATHFPLSWGTRFQLGNICFQCSDLRDYTDSKNNTSNSNIDSLKPFTTRTLFLNPSQINGSLGLSTSLSFYPKALFYALTQISLQLYSPEYQSLNGVWGGFHLGAKIIHKNYGVNFEWIKLYHHQKILSQSTIGFQGWWYLSLQHNLGLQLQEEQVHHSLKSYRGVAAWRVYF